MMKMKFWMVSVLFLLSLSFVACDRGDVYDPETSKNVADLKVPEGFDWEMSTDLPLTVSGEVKTKIDVFTDKECQNLLATLPIDTEKKTYTLSVENATEQLFIRYLKKDGQEAVVPFSIVKTRADVDFRLPEDAGSNPQWSLGSYVIYYPANKRGWGTLLFEDMWPVLGDYDFNDLAAWYKIQVNFHKKKGQDILDGIIVSARLNALGGNYPYTLCLQLDECMSSQIGEVEPYNGTSPDDYKWENPDTEEHALFSFYWPDKKGTNGGKYYNTERGHEVEDLAQNEIAFVIYPKEDIVLNNHFIHTTYNFFIRHTDGKEIHLKGYKPTVAFLERYRKIVDENEHLSQDNFYCTKDNFVWGVKVPDGISHAEESVDFGMAFQHFKEWVQSGGESFKNWYKDNQGHNYRIKVN